MHELGITQSIVAICSERAEGAAVRRVTLEIGRLSAVLPDSVRFCYDLCAEGTSLEGSVLEIVEVPGSAVCEDCGATFALDRPYGRCACGGVSLRFVAGQELRIRDMEVA